MVTKRLLVMVLVMGLAVFVAGCGGKQAVEDTSADMETPPEMPVEEEPIEVVEPEPVPVAPATLNDVFYAFDKHSLSAEAKGTLEANARELKRVSDSNFIIEGHCDERGTKAYNLALGEKRAQAAKDYLVSLGVNGSRITVVSYGKERPFDSGHTESAWAKNRRGHFVTKK